MEDVQGFSKSSLKIDGNSVLFHPHYSSGTAAVVGSKPLTRGWQHYWEVKFCSPVYGTDMMVGLATSKLDLASHQHSFASFLGHDSHSWGYSYHGSTQHAGTKTRYGEKWQRGDVIGVHLDTWRGNVYFYRNGKLQGLAFNGLLGVDVYPVVSSTAAKSEVELVTALSIPSTLQWECYRSLADKMPRSDLINIHLPPGLRNFVLNNYWFLGRLAPPPGDYYDDSPVAEVRTKTSLPFPRNKRNLLDTDEAPVTSDSEDDDECFLNIKSKKLALMRKYKASVQRSPESGASGTRHHSCSSSLRLGSLGFSENSNSESPVCTSQDHHFKRSDSDAKEKEVLVPQVNVKAQEQSPANHIKADDIVGKGPEMEDSSAESVPRSRKRFVLSSRKQK